MPTGKPIGERIREARKAIPGMTQVKLAGILNVTRGTIQNWEHARSDPSGNDLTVAENWLSTVAKAMADKQDVSEDVGNRSGK